MGSNDNTWNLMAGLAIDQMLERNENGNLYPLTSMEITVLTDIKEILNPVEEVIEKEDPKPVSKKQSKQQAKETPKDKDSFHGLNSEDLT
jgi:hypothetical protein